MSHKVKNRFLFNVNGKIVSAGLDMSPANNLLMVQEVRAVQKTRLTLDGESITITDSGGGGGGYGSLQLVDLPASFVMFFAAMVDLTVDSKTGGIDDDAAPVFAIGTAAAATNATLSSTKANIIASTSFDVDYGVGDAEAVSTSTEMPLIFDASGGSDVFLNFGVLDADISSNAALVLSGVIDLFYMDLGGPA